MLRLQTLNGFAKSDRKPINADDSLECFETGTRNLGMARDRTWYNKESKDDDKCLGVASREKGAATSVFQGWGVGTTVEKMWSFDVCER